MDRINHPSANNGRFVAKDPNIENSGTVLIAEWHNDVQDEITNAIEGSGQTLERSDLYQLSKAIQANFSVTRVELITKRDAGKLKKGAVYKVTDRTFGTLGAVSINITALANNKLSTWAEIETTFAGAIFYGLYNLGTATVADDLSYVADDRGNKVTGSANVKTFPWGNANLTNVCLKKAGSVFNYTAGVATDVTINNGTLNLISGTIQDTLIKNYGSLTHRNGVSYRNKIDGYEVDQVGTGTIRYCEFAKEGKATVGNVQFYRTEIESSNIYTDGSTGRLEEFKVKGAYVVNLRRISQLDIWKTSLSDYAYITADDASVLILSRAELSGNSRIQVASGKKLDAAIIEMKAHGSLLIDKGKLTASYLSINTQATIIHNTDAESDSISQCSASEASVIQFFGANSLGNNSIALSKAFGSAVIQIDNSANSNITYCTAASGGLVSIDDSSSCDIKFCTALSNATVQIINCNTPNSIQQSKAECYGSLVQAYNNSGAGVILGASANSTGSIQVHNSTGNNWKDYYNSSSSYFRQVHTYTADGITAQALCGVGIGTISNTWSTANAVISGTVSKNY